MRNPLSSVPELGDAFLRAVEAAHAIASPQQFFVWLRLHLHRFVPHDLALCWADGGRDAGGRRAQVLNCVPLPEALRDGLADPAARWWQQLVEQWERADERACRVALHELGADGAEHGAAALARAGFGSVELHAVRTPGRPAPELLFAFASRAPMHGAGETLTALELWMPYLQFAWWRAEAAHARRPAARPAPGAQPPLTARELQVLSAVREAKANAQIGVMLGISPLTVKNHLRSIQRKLGARNRAHAVAEAMARRLIS